MASPRDEKEELEVQKVGIRTYINYHAAQAIADGSFRLDLDNKDQVSNYLGLIQARDASFASLPKLLSIGDDVYRSIAMLAFEWNKIAQARAKNASFPTYLRGVNAIHPSMPYFAPSLPFNGDVPWAWCGPGTPQEWWIRERKQRFLAGPPGTATSCALDTVIVVLLHIEAGRMVSESNPLQLMPAFQPSSMSAIVLPHLAYGRWGSLEPLDKAKVRDQIAKDFRDYIPKFSNLCLGYESGLTLMMEIADGLDCLGWQRESGRLCSALHPLLVSDKTLQHCVDLYLSSYRFKSVPPETLLVAVTRGADFKSPRLNHAGKFNTLRLFEDLFIYSKRAKSDKADDRIETAYYYLVAACIFIPYNKHFIVRARRKRWVNETNMFTYDKDAIVEYNGLLQQGQFQDQRKQGWYGAETEEVQYLVYRAYSTTVKCVE